MMSLKQRIVNIGAAVVIGTEIEIETENNVDFKIPLFSHFTF